MINAVLLSHNGYKTTVKAEANVQIIPITTHAVSPLSPNIVEAKNKGNGIISNIMTSLCKCVRAQPLVITRLRTRTTELRAAKRNAFFKATGSSSSCSVETSLASPLD